MVGFELRFLNCRSKSLGYVTIELSLYLCVHLSPFDLEGTQ